MSNFRTSYAPLSSMILSKIADSRPESIRWPAASIVSLAGMPAILTAMGRLVLGLRQAQCRPGSVEGRLSLRTPRAESRGDIPVAGATG